MSSVKFVKKTPVYENNEKINDVDFQDFNFRVSYRKKEDFLSIQRYDTRSYTKLASN